MDSALKKAICKNSRVKSAALGARAFLPRRTLYSRGYFYILGLCRLYERDPGRVIPALGERLASLLRDSIENVPHYREVSPLEPGDIDGKNAHEALREFPYLEKKTVMDRRDDFINRRFNREKLSYSTSGGSTGEGIGLWRTRGENDMEKAFFGFEWGKMGFDFHKSRTVRFGMEGMGKEGGIPWARAGRRLLVSPYHLSDEWLETIYPEIEKFKPEFIHSYPSCAEVLARFMKKTGKPRMKLRGILLASEAFLPGQRELFSEAFDGPVSANYGLSERTNIAFSRIQGGGLVYELSEVYGVSENREDGRGNFEIVGTSYWNRAMPLIRYRTQDYGRIEGRGVIRSLDGRNREFLVSRSGGVIPGFTVKIDEFTWDYVRDFQVLQKKKGSIILRMAPRENFTAEIRDLILRKQEERWGGFFDISAEVVDEIPLTSSGKRRLVENLNHNRGDKS